METTQGFKLATFYPGLFLFLSLHGFRPGTLEVLGILWVVCGLPRDTENNPDHSEILLVSSFMSAFSIISKDFAFAYYVTIEPYKASPVRHSMFAWARSYWRILKEHVRSSAFPRLC